MSDEGGEQPGYRFSSRESHVPERGGLGGRILDKPENLRDPVTTS
jgi:hypothetical protein